MFKIFYRDRVALDSWRVVDVPRVVVLRDCWFAGGLLYGWRDRFNVVCLVDTQIDSIDDLSNPDAFIDVAASFAAGEFAYELPF